MKNHEQKILDSRKGCIGGSDLQLVLDIAKRAAEAKPLTITQKKRIRVLLGMDEPKSAPITPAIEAGREFENMTEKQMIVDGVLYEREKLIEGKIYETFQHIAHADFFCDGEVFECKWSGVHDLEELERKYYAQLQGYYLFDEVREVWLHTNSGCCHIERDENFITLLRDALATLNSLIVIGCDLSVNEISNKELPADIAEAVNEIERIKAEINQLEWDLNIEKSKLEEWLRNENVTKLTTGLATYSVTAETTRESFDSKKFKAECPDIYERFTKTTTVKGGLTIRERKEKN